MAARNENCLGENPGRPSLHEISFFGYTLCYLTRLAINSPDNANTKSYPKQQLTVEVLIRYPPKIALFLQLAHLYMTMHLLVSACTLSLLDFLYSLMDDEQN